MCRAIDAAHKVDEVKDIRDKAIALEHYARQALNTDAERRAAEIRLRAERKAGQLLTKMKESGERADKGQPKVTSTETTLNDLGITRDQSSQWQRLGAISQRDFNEALGASEMPTTKGILRSVKEEESPVKRNPVSSEALWLWGRLLDFERDGLLDQKPEEVLRTMTAPMLDDVHRLAPRVSAWLKRIGALP
jgi:hypothetical protein